MAALGADETASARVQVEGGGRGSGGGRPRGAVRRARGDGRALRRGRRAARPHPRRPGRDGAARPDPRLRRPVAGRDAARASTTTAGRCSTSTRDRHRDRLPGRGDRVLGRPAQQRPRATPGSGCARKVLPMLEDELGPGVAGALARTADQLRADMDAARRARRRTAYDEVRDRRRARGQGPRRPAAGRSARRVLRLAALDAGAHRPRSCSTSTWCALGHAGAPAWRGSEVQLPGHVTAYRASGGRTGLRFRPTPVQG